MKEKDMYGKVESKGKKYMTTRKHTGNKVKAGVSGVITKPKA